jgi:tyrosinase
MNGFSEQVESVHGYIHYDIANGAEKANNGHMWPTDYSAFEPLFWLHHANVDRIWALWQAVHPDLQLQPSTINQYGHNFWLVQGMEVNADTPLPPFWKDSTSLWTTNTISDTTVLGYAYPETQSWKYSTPEAYRAAVNASIARLYSSSARDMLGSTMGGQGHTDLTHLLVNGSYTDWTIQIEASPSEMPPTFFLRFSLVGDFSSDPVTQIGAWVMQRSNSSIDFSKRQQRASNVEPRLEATLSMTSVLLDKVVEGKLSSLDERDVVAYLKDALNWRLTSVRV